MITVVVDTTATFVDLLMKKTSWMQLLTLCHNSAIQLVIPDVVWRETARHWQTEAAKQIGIANGKIAGLKTSRARLTDLGLDASNLVDSTPITADPDRDLFAAKQEERLVSLGVQIRPVPAHVDIETILRRDLGTKKPFHSSGKGFRDALVWETLKEVALTSELGDQIFFVTSNRQDYCDDAGDLAPELLAELTTAPGETHRVHDLEQLLTHPAFKPMVARIAKSDEELATFLEKATAAPYGGEPPSIDDVVMSAVMSALERMAGEAVQVGDLDGWGTDFSDLEIPAGLEGISVDVIEADESSLTWQVYETYDDTTFLIQAEIWAQISLEGFAYKSDAVHLDADDSVYVLDWDWNDHMAHVAFSTMGKLTFQVQIEQGMSYAEDCQLESVASVNAAAHTEW